MISSLQPLGYTYYPIIVSQERANRAEAIRNERVADNAMRRTFE